MSELPVTVADHDTLVKVIRRRLDELQMSHATLEAVAGLTPGHVGKVLGPAPVKRFGTEAIWLILPALGLKMVVDQDMDAVRTMERRWEIRDELRRRAGTMRRKFSPEMMTRAIAEAGRERMNVLNSRTLPEKRKERARRAAKARWRKTPIKRRKMIARAMVESRRAKRATRANSRAAPVSQSSTATVSQASRGSGRRPRTADTGAAKDRAPRLLSCSPA